MTDVFTAAHELDKVLSRLGLPYAFIGGLALQAWGEPRLTRDVDISLLTRFENEEHVVDFLLSELTARMPEARDHALRHRVLLAKSSGGIGFDIGLAGFPYEEEMIRRSIAIEFLPSIKLPTITAEDLIVMKVFAGRPRDWADVEGILIRQNRKLKWSQIEGSLSPLLEIKQASDDMSRLLSMRAAADLA